MTSELQDLMELDLDEQYWRARAVQPVAGTQPPLHPQGRQVPPHFDARRVARRHGGTGTGRALTSTSRAAPGSRPASRDVRIATVLVVAVLALVCSGTRRRYCRTRLLLPAAPWWQFLVACQGQGSATTYGCCCCCLARGLALQGEYTGYGRGLMGCRQQRGLATPCARAPWTAPRRVAQSSHRWCYSAA